MTQSADAPPASPSAPAMRRHLDILTMLLLSASALNGVVVVIAVLLGGGALSIAMSPPDPPTRLASSVTATLFFATAAALAVWAAARWWAARGLRRGAGWSRPTALAIAVLDLFLVPFGTALSLYAFWVLMHPDVRASFRPR